MRRTRTGEVHKQVATTSVLLRRCRSGARKIKSGVNIGLYLVSGRKPWTRGYEQYKELQIRRALVDEELRDLFLSGGSLPSGYGYRIDERIIEYPWVFARLCAGNRLLLDAGSVLNQRYLLDHPALRIRSVIVFNLSCENVIDRQNVSYVCGDLRGAIAKDESFDEIVCISTLEHVGMNNAFLYSSNPRFNESRPNDYIKVVKEFKRVLKPGGKLFLTVPYGRYQDLGWLQQFDSHRVDTVVEAFAGSASDLAYYRYDSNGWQIEDADRCAESSYYDIHRQQAYEDDYIAAARAVACMELVK